jgi:hypothetical protein
MIFVLAQFRIGVGSDGPRASAGSGGIRVNQLQVVTPLGLAAEKLAILAGGGVNQIDLPDSNSRVVYPGGRSPNRSGSASRTHFLVYFALLMHLTLL